MACLELMTCLSMARFKEPGASAKYRFPFDADDLEEDLQDFYPIELFEELYDPQTTAVITTSSESLIPMPAL